MLEWSGNNQYYEDNQACSHECCIDKVRDEFVVERYHFKLQFSAYQIQI